MPRAASPSSIDTQIARRVQRSAWHGVHPGLVRSAGQPGSDRVSWLLGLLFAQPQLAPYLVFKGGTSLSKVRRRQGRLCRVISILRTRRALKKKRPEGRLVMNPGSSPG
jgi:hypothetical protein